MSTQAVETPKNMRTFMTIWVGQLISLLGSGLTSFALGVWIFEQTGRATPFAITVLFGSLPAVLLAPVAGSVADRFNRRKIMILADTGSALLTLSAALLLFTDQLAIWNIYLIALVGSTLSAFQEPAFQASVVMLVPKDDLTRANGLSQMSNAIGHLIPPLLAGFLFLAIGLRGIVIIDFVTYFAAIGTLLFVRIPQPKRQITPVKQTRWQDAMAGFRYLRVHSGLLGLVLYFAVVNFMLNMAAVLTTPMVLARFEANILGIVQMCGGLGMLAGSILLSTWGGSKRRVLALFSFIALESLGFGLIGLRPHWGFMAAGFFIAMFFVPMASGTSQSIFQVKVPPDLQGRVFAMRSMISRSIMPIAFLIAGPLADVIFEPLMSTDGALSESFIASIIGTGPGRGIGLIFLIGMIGQLAATLAAFLNPRIRNIESDIPDVEVQIESEGDDPALVEGSPLPATD